MASPENAKVKELYEGVVNSLIPTEDHTPGIPDFRAAYDNLCAQLPVPDDIQVEEVEHGGVPCIEVLHPSAMGDGVVVWFHGGGFVIGQAAGYKSFGYELSKASGAKIIFPDYRLAPEDPYPAGNDDAVAVYKALLEDGLQETDITVGGDSAGGGLAAALLVRLRDEGEPLPAGAWLSSPWCDLTNVNDSITANADKDPIVSGDMLGMLGPLYIGNADPKDPHMSAAHADLSGLPPLLIHVGTEETLYDDSIKLAERAKAAGVEVTLEIGEEMYHIYPCFGAILPEGAEAVKQAGAFVAEAMNMPTIT